MPISPTARFSLFSSALNAVIGVQLAFWPLWLTSRGLDPTQLGLLAGIGIWTRVVTTPFIGAAADRSGDRRKVMLALALFHFAASFLFIPARGFWQLTSISVITGLAFAALVPLGENATLQARVDYGRVRIWGSGTFLAMTLLVGRILLEAPPDSLLVLLLVSCVLVWGAAWLLPRTEGTAARPAPRAWLGLLTPRNGLFFLAAGLIQASHAIYYGFSSLYWRSLGYSTETIGGLWAEGVIAEIILFYWSRHFLGRIAPGYLMVLGAGAGVVRWTVLGAATSLPAFYAVNFMHCFTFAAAHLGAMYYLFNNMPPAQAATAQSLYTATQGIAFGLVSLASGALYEAYGGSAYFPMAAMAAAGALCALKLARSARAG